MSADLKSNGTCAACGGKVLWAAEAGGKTAVALDLGRPTYVILRNVPGVGYHAIRSEALAPHALSCASRLRKGRARVRDW